MSADPELEAVLDRHGLTWDLVDVDVASIDWDASDARQVRSETVNPEFVDRYAAALERGEELPAGFGMRSGEQVVVIGGQHRARAYAHAERDEMPLYMLSPVSDETAIHLASIEHNTRHGLAMSNSELCAHALDLLARGVTQDEAGRVTGLSRATIANAVAARKGSERARRLGISGTWATFSTTIKVALAGATNRRGDTVFTEAVNAMSLVNGTIDLARELARDMGDLDDDAALAVIEEFENTHIINDRGGVGGGRSGAPPIGQLRKYAAGICDLDPVAVADGVTPAFVEPTLAQIERAVRHLAEVRSKILDR